MNNENVQNRLDQAMNGGTPKINPDEQRHYLGTFRERVVLAINNANAYKNSAIDAVDELTKNDNNLVIIINGNIPASQQSSYIKIATKNNVKFNITTDKIYGTNSSDYAIVVAAKTAINKNDIDFHEPQNETKPENNVKKTFWQKLFNK